MSLKTDFLKSHFLESSWRCSWSNPTRMQKEGVSNRGMHKGILLNISDRAQCIEQRWYAFLVLLGRGTQMHRRLEAFALRAHTWRKTIMHPLGSIGLIYTYIFLSDAELLNTTSIKDRVHPRHVHLVIGRPWCATFFVTMLIATSLVPSMPVLLFRILCCADLSSRT